MPLYNPSSGGGTPGGSDTQVQFNDGGAFGGDAGLVYNKTTDLLTAGLFAAGAGTQSVPGYKVGALGIWQTSATELSMGSTGQEGLRINTSGAWLTIHQATSYAIGSSISATPDIGFGRVAAGLGSINDGAWASTAYKKLILGAARYAEQSADPSAADLTSGSNAKDRAEQYMKNDKLVLCAYNNGGTVTYVKLALDGSSTTLVHDTTAP